MGWNYRVINKDGSLGLHGVYYDEHDNIEGMDRDPNAPTGENLDELRTMLKLMLEALEKPIIDYQELDRETKAACSFCGLTQDKVPRLVAGPGVFVCSDCIAILHDIVTRDEQQTSVHYCNLCRAPGPPEQRLTVPGRGLLCHDCVSAIRAAIVNQGGDSDSG